jgi:hypothetical protein
LTAIVSTDILYMLAAPGASAGNTVAGTVGDSWGNYISSTQMSSTPLDNLFTDITGAENAASQVDYACIFILNNTSSGNSMLNTVAWLPLSLYVAGGANITVAGDTFAATAKGTGAQQAVKITSSTAAPAGVSGFVSPTNTQPTAANSYVNGIQLGTIAPGFCRAVWIKRSATNSPPVNNDGFTIQTSFDTQG